VNKDKGMNSILGKVIDPLQLQQLVYGLPLWHIFFYVLIGFTALYFSLASAGFFYGRILCQKMGFGRVIESRPLFDGQISWELKHSAVSIAIFAAYGALTIFLDKRGILSIAWEQPQLGRFLLDLVVLTLWNEVHFYLIHRSLHHPWWFKKVHRVHHRSVTTTPFSTYSFHWFEATALSSVMITAMVFWHFNVYVLIIFPAVSLFMNTIGHLNFTVFSDANINSIASASRRHAGHHKYLSGNYGFLLPYLDRWFNTRINQLENK
jgi:Delta7-sterol 5-desaturase